MWLILSLCVFFVFVNANSVKSCKGDLINQDLVKKFREDYDDFVIRLFKVATPETNDYIINSPILTYLTLIAIAEGADIETQNEIFELLNLPKDTCKRQEYYSVVTTVMFDCNTLKMDYDNTLFINQNVELNIFWYNFVANKYLLAIPVPINDSEATQEIINKYVSIQDNDLDLSGNSVLISSLSYSGLWTTSFDDAIIENKPFYNQAGDQVGYVDYMTAVRKIRISYSSSIFSTLIDLPAGVDGDYRMFIGMINGEENHKDIIRDLDRNEIETVFNSMKDYKLVEVSIPHFEITSSVDMKGLLQKMGLVNLWMDPSATRNISTPAAQPSSYIQKLTVDFNTKGINPPPSELSSNQEIEKFIANKPFSFALYDGKTFTNVFVGVYMKPKQSDE